MKNKEVINLAFCYFMMAVSMIFIVNFTTDIVREYFNPYSESNLFPPYSLRIEHFKVNQKNLTEEQIEEKRQKALRIYKDEEGLRLQESKIKIKKTVQQKTINIFIWLCIFIPHAYFSHRIRRRTCDEGK